MKVKKNPRSNRLEIKPDKGETLDHLESRALGCAPLYASAVGISRSGETVVVEWEAWPEDQKTTSCTYQDAKKLLEDHGGKDLESYSDEVEKVRKSKELRKR